MLGILLILGVCLLFGFLFWSYVGFPIQFRPKNQSEETSNGQQLAAEETSPPAPSEDEPEQSASEFQVFLSFRGPDSRQGLADVLYRDMTTVGIRVFRDDDELDVGDEISKILPAIEKSKICVLILSRSFASSTWCLREVERMVELKREIMPIFYTASPDDVKLRTELFKKDLQKHEKKHGRQRVKKWEDALKAIAKIKGREVKTTGFAEFSTLFVKALLTKLKVKQKLVTESSVKRHDHEEAVMNLLDTSAEDVRLVGIYGMGGIGKTTLAKVVFDQLSDQFDGCSFLKNIQESLGRPDGIDKLQKQLLEDLNLKLKNFGKIDPIRMLRESFHKSKVLIVLDDVNERKQIKMIAGMLGWFGSGSRIIVTTRDKRVLTGEDRTFHVEEMDYDQALQLFCMHAFGEDTPPIDYHSLSNDVIILTGGVPLAIEVIGSRLHQQEKKIWRGTIEKLKKVLNKDVKEKLKISVDALEKEEKQIFLDIACFFISKERSTPSYMWEACNYFPDVGIDALVSLSLVKITYRNEFWMHDLIRDIGRDLVRDGDPAMRTRIWTPEEAHKVLRIKQGKEKVEGLLQEVPGDRNLTHEHFSSFRNLRILKIVGVKLIGDFEDLLLELKWLSWRGCPSDFPTINLSLPNLAVLDLSQSIISEKWAGWSIIQMAKHLKALNLTGCGNLRRSPDLSNNTSLEKLSFRDCQDLVELHNSIGSLKRLKYLDLGGCHSLRGLPEDIGSLEDLEEILIEGNGNYFDIPENIGNLQSLSALKLHGVEISRIPDTISGLGNLTSLSFKRCIGLTRLSDAIGDLISLEKLNLAYTGINMLPDSIGQLVNLEVLNMSNTKVTALPDSVGNLVKLTTLRLEHTETVVLPDSIGNLVELDYLDLSSTKINVLPDSVGKLVKLWQLRLQDSEVEMLPDWVGNFCQLRYLNVGGSKIRRLPSTLWSLPVFYSLSASSCNYTPSPVPTEPHIITSGLSNLDLRVSCAAEISPIIHQHPGLSTLYIKFYKNSSSVEENVIEPHCHSPDEHLTNPNESSPDHLRPFDLGAFTRLEQLVLDCSGLKGIVMQTFPSTLRYLTLSYIATKTQLPDLSNLTQLMYMRFSHCSSPGEDVHSVVEGLRQLTKLTSLHISDCTDDLVYFSCWQLERLTSLHIAPNPQSCITCLDLSRLKRLQWLTLTRFREPTEVRGLEGVLRHINIEECASLRNIEELKRSCRLMCIDGITYISQEEPR